ncbi:twitching motility protein [Ferrimonas balearica DSM 9799]|uniref:Twitching motility protein n=1 Tax=Ferrimonas balearica (strain DSM 9799 / CCM 4581 / KCTC 23876 / PAT) TaxID=550540 RepID=E1STA9_FERBD|nr:PilT/PilU family type 4a pilus ATPase [Ferrimonas balearica]ADN77143.1 twitching motility protein [Ferrimonas balearica DSM 9799]MBW3139863.1 PilT/PilU family type 4a pilus ATPase [Ferrimonas balearica]MBW3164885.1 PilT/PilU family type 4a pilus ATPase [Ferrimonas balearica]MBY5980248.1 PilT/PilU family type 4a pilus ATPase [Ferrimonas balearica]MBY6107031.1 PilT/PilU family type 4a pilus ATPase [Ferrimonas balearica]
MAIQSLLDSMLARKASDLFITVGFPPSAKIDGELQQLNSEPLDRDGALALVESVMNEDNRRQFHQQREANFAFSVPGQAARFRVSAFWQRDNPGMVMRSIETRIPSMEELHLPEIMKNVCMAKRGLVILVGATGTGKSTSLAAMVGYRNQHQKGHILTIEDPIEFVHEHDQSIVTQREVGIDTESFDAALKSALRQAPDVILLGEIRSQETMEFALSFAETGHLCMATLHANNANQALDRILHLVPKEKHQQLLFDLSLNLRAIMAQQLVPHRDGKGRRAAIEVLLNTPRVSDLIARNQLFELKETMSKGREQGMQTFDQALFDLYMADEISMVDALHYADSPNDLRLMIKLKQANHTGSGYMDGVTIDLD